MGSDYTQPTLRVYDHAPEEFADSSAADYFERTEDDMSMSEALKESFVAAFCKMDCDDGSEELWETFDKQFDELIQVVKACDDSPVVYNADELLLGMDYDARGATDFICKEDVKAIVDEMNAQYKHCRLSYNGDHLCIGKAQTNITAEQIYDQFLTVRSARNNDHTAAIQVTADIFLAKLSVLFDIYMT